jgi:hypothetical protein
VHLAKPISERDVHLAKPIRERDVHHAMTHART